jgi:hypothetical protein
MCGHHSPGSGYVHCTLPLGHVGVHENHSGATIRWYGELWFPTEREDWPRGEYFWS